MALFIIGGVSIALFAKNIYEMKNRRTVFTAIASACMLALSILCLSEVTTFLYFNF